MSRSSTAYEIQCQHCRKPVKFLTGEVEGLDDDIEREIDDAEHEAKEEARVELYDEASEDVVGGMPSGDRPLRELAAAIRQGNREDAEYWLDRIAANLGDRATEQVQQGRFSAPVWQQ